MKLEIMGATQRMQCLVLGACDAIKALFPDHPDKRSLLKQSLPYLTDEDLDHWVDFYGLT
jgi:hypothetical protein